MPKTFVLPAHLLVYIIGCAVSHSPFYWFWVLLVLFATCFLLHRNATFSLLLFFSLPLLDKTDFHNNHHHLLEDNKSYTVYAAIHDQIANDQGNRFVLDVWKYSTNNQSIYTTLQLDWRPKERTTLSKGDSIQLHGKLFTYSKESPYESSYEAYRLRQGVLGSLSPYANLLQHIPSHNKPSLDEKIKSYIWNRPKTYFFQNEIGVIEALLTGTRSRIPQEIRRLYQSTGTIHIMSISGLHVGLLIALLLPFRPKASSSNRWIWAVLCGVSLVLFAAYFGHKPSVMRATLMGGVLILSKACLRSFPIWNALLLAAAIPCAIDPNLVYDIGFQLSFGAVLGIVVYMPKFLTYSPKNLMLKGLFSLLCIGVRSVVYLADSPIILWLPVLDQSTNQSRDCSLSSLSYWAKHLTLCTRG